MVKRALSPKRIGAVTLWLLITLPVIIGIVAIGMDGGRMLEKRRHAQATADAAALAAGSSLYQSKLNGASNRVDLATTAARSQAAANGFNNDGITSTVTVNIPPATGAFAGQADYAQVIVQYMLPKSFGAMFTGNNLPVSARAVAVGRPFQLGIVLLRQSGANAFLNSCDGTFTVVNGHIFVNSSDSASFNQNGAGSVVADAYDVTGNYILSKGSIVGPMRTGVRRTPDPFLALPDPDAVSLSVQSFAPLIITSSEGKTLQPGVYKGGFSIGQYANVLMSPGIYIMQGGGLQVLGSLTGNGVLIYNTIGSLATGPIAINTRGSVNLSASSTGIYQGISIFQDRSVTQDLIITGNGGTTITGTVYASAAAVNLTSTASTGSDTLGGAYICSSMQTGGKWKYHD